ncbi:MAG: ABC transporter substrate-binding protein [Desulfobacterales bacterium]|nr:ABC transporter substrate-binding protein [Desulfobacterales bacterium]
MNTRKTLFFVLALVLLLPFSASAGDPGVTDAEVVIGVTTPLTGPAAGWGIPISGGMQAWADHINEQGGIHGRKIKLIIKDDGYNPARAMANLQEMKNKVFAICGQLGSAPCNASKDFYPDNKIPLITAYANLNVYADQPKEKQKYYFIAYPNYEDEGEYLTNYAIQTLGVKKIAHFYQNDEYGLGTAAGIEKALAANPGKAELVASVPYEVTERALGSHALKLKQSGAELVIMTAMMTSGANMTREMAKVAFRPKVMGNFPLGDKVMYKLAGEKWEGTYINMSAHMGIPGAQPEADRVAEIVVKRNPKLKGREFLAFFGVVSVMHLAEGMKNAGRDLTRESLIQGMEQIKDWRPAGMGAPVTYGPDRHHGLNAIWPLVAKDGEHVLLGDYVSFPPKF